MIQYDSQKVQLTKLSDILLHPLKSQYLILNTVVPTDSVLLLRELSKSQKSEYVEAIIGFHYNYSISVACVGNETSILCVGRATHQRAPINIKHDRQRLGALGIPC
jgi:hypothetical protein